jgi:hypothetical protein
MTSITGSFSGKVSKQSALPLADQPNHEMSIAEIGGTQKSPDPLWNNSKLTYWGVTDLLDGEGSQHGYFNEVHPDGGRIFGTFEGRVYTTGGGTTIEGSYKYTGGEGKYRGITGSGKFKVVAKYETELDCSWEGNYELAKARAH